MPFRLWDKMQSLFLSDEEMGKKDDDHKSTRKSFKAGSWQSARVPPRKTFKRLALILLALSVVYLFIKNMPTDLGPARSGRPVYLPEDHDLVTKPPPRRPQKQLPPVKPKQEESAADSSSVRDYNAPVKFLNLATSLHAIQNTRGTSPMNKNVLFAASSLKSAATLLPVACQMGMELRSYVHFVLMGRSEIDIEELQKINGIDDACHVIFHDARPDNSARSTDARLENSVTRALYHINMYMHPQAMIVGSSDLEESYFHKGISVQATSIGAPLIEIPDHATDRLKWLTKLDSSSLAAWNKVNVDILIQAPHGSSGGLIRLLRSLSAADYTSSSVPHLTIELPQKIDPPTEKFLERFQWPPAHVRNPTNAQLLSLRHRIPRRGVSEEESSVRFLESFWPARPKNNHILVLSPQIELSRHFFHYLKYTILEYKHSTAALYQEWDTRLLGISLELPSTNIDGTSPFSPPPTLESVQAGRKTLDTATPFLWQAPNSNGALYFGEKWVELHGFVSHLLAIQPNLQQPSELLAKKLVSKKFPSWLEHALRLSRARGYWTLYPSQTTVTNLATVHNELYNPPEEYEKETSQDMPDAAQELTLGPGSLLDSLPDGGSLAPFNDLPLVSWDGKQTKLQQMNDEALSFAAEFRRSVGGCTMERSAETLPDKSARDLFCTPT